MQRFLGFAYYGILVLLESVFFANVYVEHNSGLLRLGYWSFFFLLALTRPRFGFLFLVASLGWTEVPLLKFGYPNQFLSDVGILGFCAGYSVRRLLPYFRKEKSENSLDVFIHPVFGVFLALTVLATSYLVPSIYELNQLSFEGLGARNFLHSIVRTVFDWDMQKNAFHRFSVIFGYAIQLSFIAFTLVHRKSFALTPTKLLWALCMGGVPIVAFAAAQMLIPKISKTPYTMGISGLFQNENHLSFYCGLALLCCVVLRQSKVSGPLLWSLIGLFTFGLIAGKGHTSWASLLASILFGASIQLFIYTYPKIQRRRLEGVLLYGLPLGVVIGGLFLFLNPLSRPLVEQIVTAGGRGPHFAKAMQYVREFPLFGLGIDAFFNRAIEGYEVHSLILGWAVALGIPAVLFTLAIFVVWYRDWFVIPICAVAKQKKYFDPYMILLCSLAYIFVAHLEDVFISYRSLFSIVSVVGSAFALHILPQISLRSLKKNVLMTTLIVGLAGIYGLMSFTRPQTMMVMDKGYGLEVEDAKQFNWVSPVLVLDLPAKTCISFDVRPVYHSGSSSAKVLLVAPQDAPKNYWMLSDFVKFESTFGPGRSLNLINGGWNHLCFCQQAGDNKLYFRHEKAEILSTSKYNYHLDDRFISFALSDIKQESMARSKDCTVLP